MSAPQMEPLAIGVDSALRNCAHYLRDERGLTAAAEQIEAVTIAVAELVEVATSAKNALAIIAGSEESDTSDKWYQLLFEDLPRLREVLARVGGAA